MSEAVIGKNHPLQSAATTGNGTAYDLKGACREITVYIVGSSGVGAGAIQVETAHDPAYAGTWAAIGSATTVVASASLIVRATGCYGAIRARVSTTVTGGTVSCYLFAN